MNPAEQRYFQIEKECLAICNCFKKFDQWLYGKPHHRSSHKSPAVRNNPAETTAQSPCTPAEDVYKTAALPLHTEMQERASPLFGRLTLSGSPTAPSNSPTTPLRYNTRNPRVTDQSINQSINLYLPFLMLITE